MSDDAGARRRRLTFAAGHRAELVALLWLAVRGYRILARRFGVRGGEVDIVARRGALVVFVEVKRRPTHEEGLSAITETKRRRIERAAAVWLAHHPWAVSLALRGDAVVLAPRRWPRHVPDAFPLRLG